MCLVALITKWLCLTRNLHTKPPFTLAWALSTAAGRGGGGNAILKLQLPHIPETAKLQLFSQPQLLSPASAHSAPTGRPPSSRAGLHSPQQIKAEPLPL